MSPSHRYTRFMAKSAEARTRAAGQLAAEDQLIETKKAIQARKTQRLLLDVGRQLFAAKGYAETSIEDICEATRMTRGALYHHYRGKGDLFRAVLEDVEQQLVQRVARKADVSPEADPWEVLERGVRAFLNETSDPVVQQIVMVDGPSVLGYAAWREIDERYAFGVLLYVMRRAMEAGEIEEQPVDPLARLLLASLNEASLAIAQADKPRVAKREMTEAVLFFLNGLRVKRRRRP
jgi:AcrR family transcriptional regulator